VWESITVVVGAPGDSEGTQLVAVTKSVYPSTHQYIHQPTLSGMP
jgi:hypothetical protein